jgi:uncharacterized protein YwgA
MLMSQLAGNPGEPYPLDRIRAQKAVFLLTRRGSEAWKTLYNYQPYNWGPYSSQLASDLDRLVRLNCLEVAEVPGSRYGRYRTTIGGEDRAQQIWTGLKPSESEFIRSVRAYVTHRSFTELLREVYAEYPEFASVSYFSG